MHRILLLAVGLLFVPACNVGSVSFEMVFSPIPAQHPFRLKGPLQPVEMEVRVEADDFGPIIRLFPIEAGASLRFPRVPVGDDRVVTVEGLTAEGQVVFRGKSLPLSIRSGHRELELYVATVGGFSNAPVEMRSVRFGHVVNTLPDGLVLVSGGATEPVRLPDGTMPALVSEGAELFDATSASFVTEVPAARRAFHAGASVDRGVLLAGGLVQAPMGPNISELYETDTGTFTVPDSSGGIVRSFHDAAPLPGGNALVAGGFDVTGTVLDHATEFSSAGRIFLGVEDLNTPRAGLRLSAFSDASVLVSGGFSELYATADAVACAMECGECDDTWCDVCVGDWCAELAMGCAGRWCAGFAVEAERFDPVGRRFAFHGAHIPRAFHTATPVPSSEAFPGGAVVLIGGLGVPLLLDGGFVPHRSIEVCVPDEPCFEPLDNQGQPVQLSIPRWRHTATLLDDGSILVVGGWTTFDDVMVPTNTAEIVEMAGEGVRLRPAPRLTVARAGHAATRLGNGMVLIVGGVGSLGEVTDVAEIYNP